MSLKNLTKSELIERIEELESEVSDLEMRVDDQDECECQFENDMEITDLKSEKEELEDRVEELEGEVSDLENRVNELENQEIDIDELDSVTSNLQDALNTVQSIRDQVE